MQFLDCNITLSFSNQKIKDRSETLINKGNYEVNYKFIVSLIILHIMMEYTISVLLPCYNAEKTITDTLSSVNNQDLGIFEFVIINDGSDDGTIDRIREFVFNPGIECKIISRANKGFLYTLVEGIEISTGTLIARIDSDDLWEPNHLSSLLIKLKSEDLVLVGSNALIIDADNKVIGRTNMPNSDKLIRKGLLKDNMFIHSSVLFRRDVYEKTTGYLLGASDGEQLMADYNLWVEFASHGTVGNLSAQTLRYRYLQTSMSRITNKISNYKSRLKIQKKAYNLLGGSYIYHLQALFKTCIKIFYYSVYAYCKI